MGFAEFAKAITAGTGTDSAGLTGGAALRRESLHGVPVTSTIPDYHVAAGRALTAIRKPGTARCGHFGEPQGRWLRKVRSGMHPQLLQPTSL